MSCEECKKKDKAMLEFAQEIVELKEKYENLKIAKGIETIVRRK